MPNWDDQVHPDYGYPRHRLMETYNWLNFKALMVAGTWGLVVLIVLVVWVVEGR